MQNSTNNTNNKLDVTQAKLSFILKLSADFTDFCTAQLEDLFGLVEHACLKGGSSDISGETVSNVVKTSIRTKMDKIINEYTQEKESILRQLESVNAIVSIEDAKKKEVIAEFFLEEVDPSESMQSFKERILKDELEERKSFKSQVDDMKATVAEGGLLELEAFFEEWLNSQSEQNFIECEEDCEGCQDCDFDDQEEEDENFESDSGDDRD